jgi:riboflavin kinase / FMN adenylyltransferase
MTPPSRTPAIFAGSSAYPSDGPGPVLSIGNFDGVHAGHRHLLAKVVARARAMEVPACIYTFDPPPRVVLAPAAHQPRILGWPDKVRLLAAEGVDQVVVERFTRAFAQHPPEWFVEEILGRRLRPSALVVGYDFRFGKARAGDLAMVKRLLPHVPVNHVDALQDEGTVSSSRIRESVLAGRVAEAGHLLGRPHFVKGTVVSGDKRGRKIGFPTANLDTAAELLPPIGVYAVRARIDGEGWRDAVANLGVRPTFGAASFSVEVHVLDYRGDLYGREVAVAFVERLRGEQKFSDVAALQDQIRLDVVAARGLLAAPP